MTVSKLVSILKDSEQDFEFYPTTDEIINKVKEDIKDNYYRSTSSILDIGCGNGKVLNAFKDEFSELYAIEKSQVLISTLPANIFIIGTEFFNNHY
jgi:16S rRNA A1518/A1519 N6-dimethyltransferase RsmA/KsgA/DIM1 with predicted DNA glycosylase/AP lyase activity